MTSSQFGLVGKSLLELEESHVEHFKVQFRMMLVLDHVMNAYVSTKDQIVIVQQPLDCFPMDFIHQMLFACIQLSVGPFANATSFTRHHEGLLSKLTWSSAGDWISFGVHVSSTLGQISALLVQCPEH